MKVLRSLLAFVLPALAGIMILLAGQVLGRRAARNLATITIGRLGTWLAGIRVRIEDDAGLAMTRPAVFVFNHQSGIDPVLLCYLLRRDVVGVAKRELRRHPLLGPLLTLAGTVFVDRGAHAGSAALAPAVRALDHGLAVAIAPQGTRRLDMGRCHPGAIWLADHAGAALIPVIIQGAGAIQPPGQWLMTPGEVVLRVLPALDASDLTLDQLEQCFHDNQSRRSATACLDHVGPRP